MPDINWENLERQSVALRSRPQKQATKRSEANQNSNQTSNPGRTAPKEFIKPGQAHPCPVGFVYQSGSHRQIWWVSCGHHQLGSPVAPDKPKDAGAEFSLNACLKMAAADVARRILAFGSGVGDRSIFPASPRPRRETGIRTVP
jgi:hypothetical protein